MLQGDWIKEPQVRWMSQSFGAYIFLKIIIQLQWIQSCDYNLNMEIINYYLLTLYKKDYIIL